MTRWTLVLTSEEGKSPITDAWLEAANDLSTADSRVALSAASPALPDKKGTGDIVWSLTLPDGTGPSDVPAAAALLDTSSHPVRICECIPVEPIAARSVARDGSRVLRTLLIKVRPGAPPDGILGLEASLIAMPGHITSIQSWALSRIAPGCTRNGWTHLWEQEFAEARGFRPYMGHPYHWTGVERWFDPEIPGFIVHDESHFMTEVPGPVLSEPGTR